MNQEEYIGVESLKQLGSVLKELSSKRILLVTGKDSYSNSGAEKYMAEFLAGCKVTRFFDFSSNPKDEDVKKGIELFGQVQPDTVIAVGGGSVIDMAKLVNFFAANALEPLEYFNTGKSDIRKPKPLVAIPTTAGSGSEATSFAVLYIDKEKFSVDNEFILPDVAIVDAALTTSLPKYVTATTGMDALCQAIESYWSINSNDESKGFASNAIELIINNLVTAVNQADSAARLAMAKAANLAGKAINITRTTAPHAISYPLTSYFGIAHGHAVGLTLSSLLLFNAQVTEDDVLDSRGVEYVKETISKLCTILDVQTVQGAKQRIDAMISECGLQIRLSSLGLKKEDIEIITNEFNADRAKNNPRVINKESLQKILLGIF